MLRSIAVLTLLACSRPTDVVLAIEDPSAVPTPEARAELAAGVVARLEAADYDVLASRVEGDAIVVTLPGPLRPDREPGLEHLFDFRGELALRPVATEADLTGTGIDLESERAAVLAWIEAHSGEPLDGLDAELAAREGRSPAVTWHAQRPERDSTAARPPLPLLVPAVLFPSEDWTFDERSLEKAYLTSDPLGYPAVGIVLQDSRHDAFRAFTDRFTGRQLAVVLDGEVLSTAGIEEPLPGRALLRGNLDGSQAGGLVRALGCGALASTLRFADARTDG